MLRFVSFILAFVFLALLLTRCDHSTGDIRPHKTGPEKLSLAPL